MAAKKPKAKSTRAPQRALVVFFTTFSVPERAREFARAVLSRRLAACVNLVEGMTSYYVWKGETFEEKEILAIGKTTKTAFAKLKAQIKNLHPYETPELICFDIKDGFAPYLKWVADSSK